MPRTKTVTKSAATNNATTTSGSNCLIKTLDTSKYEKDLQLIDIKDFDYSKLVFSEPQTVEMKSGGSFKRVWIKYIYPNGKVGQCIFGLSRKYCFGVQPDNLDKDGKVDEVNGKPKEIKGYKVPIVMHGKEITPEEENEIGFLDTLYENIQNWAVSNKKQLGMQLKADEIVKDYVTKFPVRRIDKQTGDIDQTVSPKLYVPLKYYWTKQEFDTPFYGPGDKEIDPLSMQEHFYIYPNIELNNIYIGGGKISLQMKVYDATVEPKTRVPKKRLARPNTLTKEDVQEAENSDDDEEDVENASGSESDNDPNNLMESDSDEE